jgi:predicted RNA-binding protein with PUA-like domain
MDRDKAQDRRSWFHHPRAAFEEKRWVATGMDSVLSVNQVLQILCCGNSEGFRVVLD